MASEILPSFRVRTTLERVSDLLAYCPKSGKLTWKRGRGHVLAGAEAGVKTRSAIKVGLDNCDYVAHRICWLLHYGEWPSGILDHIDGNPHNNRISNLRVATLDDNQHNQGIRKSNTSGIKGVSFDKARGKYVAQIMANRKKYSLGRFDTKEEAAIAYRVAAKILHGEFARTT